MIGDNALFTDHEALGLEKMDLGEEWIGMTGLPFVYAFWAGPPGRVGADDVAGLQEARDRGLAATATIGQQAFPDSPERAARADRYLRENVKYALGEREVAGIEAVLRAGGGGGCRRNCGRRRPCFTSPA